MRRALFSLSLRVPVLDSCWSPWALVFGSGPLFLSIAVVGVHVLVLFLLTSSGHGARLHLPPLSAVSSVLPFVFPPSVIVFGVPSVFLCSRRLRPSFFGTGLPHSSLVLCLRGFGCISFFFAGVVFPAIFPGRPCLLVWLAMRPYPSLPPRVCHTMPRWRPCPSFPHLSAGFSWHSLWHRAFLVGRRFFSASSAGCGGALSVLSA